MKLFVLTNNPARASFRQRIGVYLYVLQANGIDCEVAQLPSSPLARRKLFKRAAGFDGVFLHKKRLNVIDAFWLCKYSKKIIYNFDDAVMYSDKNPDKLSRKRQNSFKRTVRQADMVIAGNSYLADHTRRFNKNVEVIPTGLDVSTYNLRTAPKNDGKIRLVWIGSRSTLKYLAGIKPALEEIGSCFDNVILRIISDDFLDLQNISVEKHPWSEQTQVIDLVTSDIGLAPLPDNQFTRGKCGFKILQYAAAGLPVIASPVGVNVEYVSDGNTGFHAANISQWIDRIGRAVKNSELRGKMGQAGRNKVQEFDVRIIGKRLVDLIMRSLQDMAP